MENRKTRPGLEHICQSSNLSLEKWVFSHSKRADQILCQGVILNVECKVYLLDCNYRFEILDSHERSVGVAHIESRDDAEGKFWHLEDLLIDENNRNRGYGTILLSYLRDYLWNIDRLRIRVHPAVGQQAMETLGKQMQFNQQQYTEAELDELDKSLEEMLQKPDFWESQEKILDISSDELREWYKKRGFSVTFDEKYLWCFPTSSSSC